MEQTCPVLEDFDWEAHLVVSSSRLESLPDPVPLVKLKLRLSDGTTRVLELTSSQLDEAISALSDGEKRMRLGSKAPATSSPPTTAAGGPS